MMGNYDQMAPAAYKGQDLKIPTVKTVCGCEGFR